MGRRLAGAATHTLSLPALDDEIEPLHPPKTTATPTSATQASSGQGPAQHPNSHCRWIRRFTYNKPSFSSFSLYSLPFLIPQTPLHLPTRIFAGSAEISIEFLHVFFPIIVLIFVVMSVLMLRFVCVCAHWRLPLCHYGDSDGKEKRERKGLVYLCPPFACRRDETY